MAKKSIWLFALVPFFAFQSVPASACKVVGHTSDGEPLCMTTSDGKGQQYTDGRSARDRMMARVRARLEREARLHRVIKHQGANW